MDGRTRHARSLRQPTRAPAGALEWVPGGPTGAIHRLFARRGSGVAAALALVLVSIGYGIVEGGHAAATAEYLRNARDAAANVAGFGIEAVSVAGLEQVDTAEALTAAGLTESTSLLFLDVEAARSGLKTVPWIAEATVRKLYPNRLQIAVEERAAFALWQNNGKVSVIAADGTVLAPFGDRRFVSLPLVVGIGAEQNAKAILGLLDRFPAVREQVRAAIRVADRRWNLKLKNGLDVRLPESGVEQALEALVALDKSLVSRDITAIDLRLPDRVTVRLSEAAAQARADAIKDKKAKRKGGDA